MRRLGWLVAVIIVLLVGLPAAAQSSEVVLQVAVPEFLRDAFSDEVLARFEAMHPGVQVEVVSTMMAGIGTPAYDDVQAHLEGLQKYVSSTDVLLVDSNSLSVEGTRAGLFMDLSPLANADSDLNTGDFLPQAWQSFQWDRGIWALPVGVDVVLLLYNPAAFDEAGIAYPDEGWTIDDFATAARALAKTNTDGEKEPGFFDFGTAGYLLRSLLGASVVDSAATNSTPDFSSPELERLLTIWNDLLNEGAVAGVGAGARIMMIGGRAGEGPPMTVQRSFGLATFPGNPEMPTPSGSLLPGGMAGLEVQGAAVSAGTRYPELAYELAKFLTSSPEIATQLFGFTPARRSLQNVEVEVSSRRRGFLPASLSFSAEAQAIIDKGFTRALSAADMRFMDYVRAALDRMQSERLDAALALQEAEAAAISSLNRAADMRRSLISAVATPIPQIALGSGEIELSFGVASFIRPLPNQDRWQQIIDQFVAADPEVGRIRLDTEFDLNLENLASRYDCFYLPTNAVPGGNVSGIMSLDPMLDADPQFDRADLVSGVLAQVRFDNRTWAYPLAIQPEVLRYNPDLFARAGVPVPENGWTVDQFVDALQRLKPLPEDEIPFIPRDFTGQYLYNLIAAFGGIPIDNRTDPPTINFTDPATVDAIRQALDLAKNGYIEYTPSSGAGGVDVRVLVGGEDDTAAIYTHTLGAFSFFTRLNAEGQIAQDSYRVTTYPRGSRYVPVAYDINTAYISASAANPSACYRWISELAKHPDLFSAMPARRSMLNDPSIAPDLAALYRQMDVNMSDPGVIVSPSALRASGAASIWRQFWLRRAFDRYVRDGADLETELAQAEQFTRDYETCAAGIPRENPATPEDQMTYFQQFQNCVKAVDPSAL